MYVRLKNVAVIWKRNSQANRVGERRLREMITKYGTTDITAYMQELCEYASRMVRARLQEIPDGRYVYTDVLDNDGISE